MPLEQILFPRPEFVVPRRFAVVVLAGRDITRVAATVAPPPGGKAVVAEWVMTRFGDRRPRWRFVVQGSLPEGQEEGTFDVTLTGFTGERGDVAANSLKQAVQVTRAGWDATPSAGRLGAGGMPEAINISYPPNGHTTTPEEWAGGLVAWGQFTDGNEAVSATMNATPADYLASYGDEWYAIFPPVADGQYTLMVVNSANESDSKTVYVQAGTLVREDCVDTPLPVASLRG